MKLNPDDLHIHPTKQHKDCDWYDHKEYECTNWGEFWEDTEPAFVEVKINPVDKTELKAAIANAKKIYESIKNEDIYAKEAEQLNSAIIAAEKIAENDNVDKTAVSEAITVVNKAKADAESGKKAVDDTITVNKVTDTISKLPASDKVTTADKAAIEAARKAYDALTEDQKKLVDSDTVKKLTDAEEALKSAENKKDEIPEKKYKYEWVDGLWYNIDGTQTYEYKGEWKTNGTGWWYEDTTGWYPTNCWLKIDGYWYYFGGDGYMLTNQYIDGYWVGADGACQ